MDGRAEIARAKRDGCSFALSDHLSYLREAFEGMFENEPLQRIRMDLVARSTLICEPTRAMSWPSQRAP